MSNKKKYIIVVGKYPDDLVKSDGMMIRVMEIDKTINDIADIIYLDLHPRNKSFQVTYIDGRKVIRLCPLRHIRKLHSMLSNAAVIYCHSIINYAKIAHLIDVIKVPVILDAHGVVSEEYKMQKKYIHSIIFNILEKLALSRCQIVVSVTREMKSYFRKINSKIGHILLPIFDESVSDVNFTRKTGSFVYAGGDQVWQNVPLMMELPQILPQAYFNFLFPPHIFGKYKSFESSNVKISTASRSELQAIYFKSSMGIILREDSLVNRVALPTKLNEYIKFGILPVVIQPNIGDFIYYEYEYLLYDKIVESGMPPLEEISAMASRNLAKYQAQTDDARVGTHVLRYIVSGFVHGRIL